MISAAAILSNELDHFHMIGREGEDHGAVILAAVNNNTVMFPEQIQQRFRALRRQLARPSDSHLLFIRLVISGA